MRRRPYRFGPTVPLDIEARVEEVVTAMVAGRAPVPTICVTWNTRVTSCAARVHTGLSRLGVRLGPPRVELSKKAWPILTREEQEATLIHESAHVAAAILGYVAEHHGPRWRKLMRDYGAPADRCLSLDATKRLQQAYPRKTRARKVRYTLRTLEDVFALHQKK